MSIRPPARRTARRSLSTLTRSADGTAEDPAIVWPWRRVRRAAPLFALTA
jgi:hypothetical protein